MGKSEWQTQEREGNLRVANPLKPLASGLASYEVANKRRSLPRRYTRFWRKWQTIGDAPQDLALPLVLCFVNVRAHHTNQQLSAELLPLPTPAR